jgi:hypothetical protein
MSDSSSSSFDNSPSLEKALEHLEDILISKDCPPLKSSELAIISGTWNNLTYEEIADSYIGLSLNYIERDLANKLWKKIGNILSLQIDKNNFKSAFIRYCRQNNLSLIEKNRSEDRSNTREYCYIKVDTNVYTVEISIPNIGNDLRYSTGDFSIQIERKVIPGSAIFFCNGTVRSVNRLVTMFAEGNLTQVAGLRILDLNFIRVWLERLFSHSWEEQEQILARSGNRNIRSGGDLTIPTLSSLSKARVVQCADNIQLIILAKLEYNSALETDVTFSIYPDPEPYLPINLTIEILDEAGSVVMEERVSSGNIDAIELTFTLAIEEHFGLRITYHDREIIEQF